MLAIMNCFQRVSNNKKSLKIIGKLLDSMKTKSSPILVKYEEPTKLQLTELLLLLNRTFINPYLVFTLFTFTNTQTLINILFQRIPCITSDKKRKLVKLILYYSDHTCHHTAELLI